MSDITGCVGKGGYNDPADVRLVQSLLNRHAAKLGYPPLATDGVMNAGTVLAIQTFQKQFLSHAFPDGWLSPGDMTDRALQSGGERTPEWPPKPDFKPLVNNDARAKLFGKFEFVADPQPRNPEHVKILGDWVKQNIVGVKLDMGPTLGTKTMQFHKLAAKQLEKMWLAWKKAGLLDRVISYAGSFAPRYVRGSTKNLSNHAFASAFDINAAWNGLGKVPALVGDKGCTRELVPIAHEHGFYWGGHFTRQDGMHFEVAKII